LNCLFQLVAPAIGVCRQRENFAVSQLGGQIADHGNLASSQHGGLRSQAIYQKVEPNRELNDEAAVAERTGRSATTNGDRVTLVHCLCRDRAYNWGKLGSTSDALRPNNGVFGAPRSAARREFSVVSGKVGH
jgi:hypothetical protein